MLRVKLLINKFKIICLRKRYEENLQLLRQVRYCFDIAYDDEGASLLINSDEQM